MSSIVRSVVSWRSLLLAIGGVVLVAAGSSLFLAGVDQCLAGRWQIVSSSSFPKAGALELRPDGSAEVNEFQGAPYSGLWKVSGDILEVALVSRPVPEPAEDQIDPGITWRLRWEIIEKGSQVLRLRGPLNSSWPSGDVALAR